MASSSSHTLWWPKKALRFRGSTLTNTPYSKYSTIGKRIRITLTFLSETSKLFISVNHPEITAKRITSLRSPRQLCTIKILNSTRKALMTECSTNSSGTTGTNSEPKVTQNTEGILALRILWSSRHLCRTMPQSSAMVNRLTQILELTRLTAKTAHTIGGIFQDKACQRAIH